ncbi:MAG TPA: class A beta-lactamase [Allosphingosinicella sp.]|nr:class A beta-lactamase [Allosphingosinicella sp.]
MVVAYRRSARIARLALLPAAALLSSFVPQATIARTAAHQAQGHGLQSMAPQNEAQRILALTIRGIGENFNGDIGIAIEDVQTGWTTAYDGDTFFPQQSVSKFWVALTALDKVDRGELSLTAPFTLHKDDVTLFHQPIAAQIGANGYRTNIAELMTRALQQSDNTCNDAVLWRAGGPEAVRAFLRNKGIEGIRFGPGERKLQSAIAGIEWHQSYASNGGFYKARDALPYSARKAAFERYIASPMDGAAPLGVVDALSRLKRGELLSAASTQRLLGIMSHTKTGPQRLKGGLQPGWTLSHKTGTGQVLGGVQAGYNDIGVITGPDGHSYAMAVLIRRSSAPLQQRMAAMQATVRAAIAYHRAAEGTDMAGYRGSGGYGGR